MYKILFVCTGNICRSPTADGLFKKMIKQHGLSDVVWVDSAGLSSWHEGQPPDSRSIKTAQENGLDISDLKARQFVRDDFQNFDLIIAMDTGHFRKMNEMRPAFSPEHNKAEICMMMDFSSDYNVSDVPDPYYSENGFQNVFDMIESACKGLLKHIQEINDNAS